MPFRPVSFLEGPPKKKSQKLLYAYMQKVWCFTSSKKLKQQMQTPKPPFFSIQWLWFSHILPATAELIMTQSIESGIAYAQTCCKKNVLAFSGTSSHGSSKPTTSCSCPSPLGSFFGEPLPTKACTCINMYCYAFCRLCHHSQELVLKQHMWF